MEQVVPSWVWHDTVDETPYNCSAGSSLNLSFDSGLEELAFISERTKNPGRKIEANTQPSLCDVLDAYTFLDEATKNKK